MITSKKNEAKANFDRYLREKLITKQANDLAKAKYIENAKLSLQVAKELIESKTKPHLWVIVTSYYAMFYIANAVLLHLGYKVGDKIAHKVTLDSLIVLVLDRLKKGLLENYEDAQQDALDIANARAEAVIDSYAFELDKRSRFQYNMLEQTKEEKAKTSLQRASEFLLEMNKLL